MNFNLAGKKAGLTAVKIVAIILISLMIIYAVLRVARGRIEKVKRK